MAANCGAGVHQGSPFNGHTINNPSAAAAGSSGISQGLKHDPGLAVEWSAEEQSVLEDELLKFANESSILRCIKIAALLPEKNVRDVALRCRWMSRKENGKRRKGEEQSSAKKIKDKKCPNGHTLCSGCKSMVNNRCPTCRYELGNIRCLALEKVAASLELPCKYQSYGCEEIFPYYSKLKHEAECTFRPYNCPYAGSECKVVGDIPFLVGHLRDYHKVDMHDGFTFNHRYVKSNPLEVENATWMLTVFNCFGKYFCLHFEAFQLGKAPVYIAFLRFMGDDNEAKNFSYSLEVGGNGRKLTWQGVPRSVRDSHRKVRESLDGLIIQRTMALSLFSGSDRKELKLRLTGRIWKLEQ